MYIGGHDYRHSRYAMRRGRPHGAAPTRLCAVGAYGSLFWGNQMMNANIIEIVEILKNRHETISFAESCTGGGLTHAFALVPGVSSILRGGIVAYHPEVKIGQLHVLPAIIERNGIVSRETAIAMAAGVAQALAADWSAATTGYAGPTGGDNRYGVGTVCYAIMCPKHAVFQTGCLHLNGSREQIMMRAVDEVVRQIGMIVCA